VTLPHHDAAHGDERRCGKAELFSAEQGSDDQCHGRSATPVGLHRDAAAQVVQQQHLLGLGETKFPRQSCVLDGISGEAPVPPVSPEMSTTFGVSLRDAGGNCSDATSETSLTAMRACGFTFLRSLNQLSQILDGMMS